MPLKSCNTENMQRFVAALRSGEFTQGIGWLEKTDNDVTKNCCLGVACRVAYRDGVELNPSLNVRKLVEFAGVVDYMPESVSEWLGLDAEAERGKAIGGFSGNPLLISEVGNPGGLVTASELNDTHKYSFSQIADAFERTYLKD